MVGWSSISFSSLKLSTPVSLASFLFKKGAYSTAFAAATIDQPYNIGCLRPIISFI